MLRDDTVGPQGTARTREEKAGGLWPRTTSCSGQTQPAVEQISLCTETEVNTDRPAQAGNVFPAQLKA